MAAWLIRKDPRVQQYWRRLEDRSAQEQEAFATAERVLSEQPHPFHHPAGVIKHLKGGYLCNHEYRSLPNAQRIFYKIWTREEITEAKKRKQTDVPPEPDWEEGHLGLVVMFYAGPHPR